MPQHLSALWFLITAAAIAVGRTASTSADTLPDEFHLFAEIASTKGNSSGPRRLATGGVT